MGDILYNAAKSFSNAIKFDYIYTLGNKKRKIKISVLSSQKDEFTHIFGIDHIADIPKIAVANSKQKIAVYNKILNKEITFLDIKYSVDLNKPIDGTYNIITGKPYTIKDRIEALQNIEYILDNSYNGKIYRWDIKKSNIIQRNGKTRRSFINADYLLVVPSKRHSAEKYYLFLYQTNKDKKDEPIKLNVFSAFPDCVDVACGQVNPYTILKEVKYEIRTKTDEVLFVHSTYKNTKM